MKHIKFLTRNTTRRHFSVTVRRQQHQEKSREKTVEFAPQGTDTRNSKLPVWNVVLHSSLLWMEVTIAMIAG